VTDQGNKYAVYFLSSGSIFEQYPHLAKNIYWFNIDIKKGNADTSIHDERIGLTVFEVFKIFFDNMENVAVYVCDISDNRQQSRQRKFNLWFWRFNDGSIIKEDGEVIAGDLTIYNSILVHRDNPHLAEIVRAFKELNDEAGK
jgi:hypothetical protein